MKECLVIEKSSRYNNASEISFQSSYPQIDDSIVARSHFVLISEVAYFFFPFFFSNLSAFAYMILSIRAYLLVCENLCVFYGLKRCR